MKNDAAVTPPGADDKRMAEIILFVLRRTGSLSHQPDADAGILAAAFGADETERSKRAAEAADKKGR